MCYENYACRYSRDWALFTHKAYGTRRFNITLTRSPIIPILNRINQFFVLVPVSLKSILILPSHLCIGFPIVLFPVDVPVSILVT